VRLKGKSQVVQYGRLGGSLRELRKSFRTPTEAAEKTEKRIAAKKRDGYVEISPSRLEIVRLKGRRTATERQIKAVEEQIGCTLPKEYSNFLKKYNGGRPNPDCVQVPGVKGIDNVGVGSLFHLQPSRPRPPPSLAGRRRSTIHTFPLISARSAMLSPYLPKQ
jgi:predicted DNA-binding WGR domain protein